MGSVGCYAYMEHNAKVYFRLAMHKCSIIRDQIYVLHGLVEPLKFCCDKETTPPSCISSKLNVAKPWNKYI